MTFISWRGRSTVTLLPTKTESIMTPTIAIPQRLRLDNAANISPASMTKSYSSLYRMSVTLNEAVDLILLQKALELTSERIPTFRCTLSAGSFWWYLDRTERAPRVRTLKPLKHFRFQDQDGLLYRISADGRRIVLDVFHALADGHGAQVFLLTLTGAYLKLKYGIHIAYNSLVLNPADPATYAEVEDSFKTVFSGRHGQLEQNVDAWHIPGHKLPDGHVKDLRMVLPMNKLQEATRQYDCTVTELLIACMLDALQVEHGKDHNPRRKSVLKVSVPVNLRPRYGSSSLRNFSSYVNLGVDVCNGYLTFPSIVKTVKKQKAWALQKENLEPKIAANVELEENLGVRCIPLWIKHPIIDIINRLHGDRYVTQTLSNLGKVVLPESMQPYVLEMDFVLGRQRGNSGAASCLSYNGQLYLHLSRKIVEDSFERNLTKRIQSLGIPVKSTLTDLA